jgi:hypothetical protein
VATLRWRGRSVAASDATPRSVADA